MVVMGARYVYNPACRCPLCSNGGEMPKDHPDRGHAFGYEENTHIPPSSSPWKDGRLAGTPTSKP